MKNNSEKDRVLQYFAAVLRTEAALSDDAMLSHTPPDGQANLSLGLGRDLDEALAVQAPRLFLFLRS